MTVTNLQAVRQASDRDENARMAKTFLDAAQRAMRGDFRSVAWCAQGRNEFAAHFAWHKFGSIMPLIGAGYTMLQEMANSPAMPLGELEESVDAGQELSGGSRAGDLERDQLELFDWSR